VSFHEDVRATLRASSFLLSGGGVLGPIEYQSPNRTEDLSKPDEVITIGKTTYQEIDNHQWGEGPLTFQMNNLFGPYRAKFVLRQLIGLTSVKRITGGFIAKQVVPVATLFPDSAGQALVFWTVRIWKDPSELSH
jgi:hypothetical protein